LHVEKCGAPARRQADQDAGRVLGVPDGYLITLTMTTGAVHEVPDHNPAKQHFKSG
jgi:hypothetical protein